jgi:REP element-mobilizing transposase RayT
MPKGLRRRYGQRHLHFITCSCYRRLPLFASVRSKNLLVKILGEVRDRYGFLLVGYVVMPEHIHLLVSEPVKGTPSTIMQVLKQRVSRRLRRKPRASPRQTRNSLPGLRSFLASILAAQVLRFQRVESEEESGKAPLHAHEPYEAKTCHPSERLALEQFLFLRNSGFWFAAN